MRLADLIPLLSVVLVEFPEAGVAYDHEYGINITVPHAPSSVLQIFLDAHDLVYHTTLGCFFPKKLEKRR